ncbi:hypothetical protein FJZ18_01835 [Candidatus Pacearchaeota archaeon]|nr:hypothetical protein [Candidatus Pacearchaeota archaeon]
MLLELSIAFVLGILAGVFTGLAPGIHINLVASFLLFLSPPESLLLPASIFIIAMSISHSCIDFIPSIFLGAPEEDTFLSILPGHEMLKEGRGQEAVAMTSFGALASIPIILFISPVYLYFLPSLYNSLRFFIPFVLVFLSLYLIFREKDFLKSGFVFILAGVLGHVSFSLPSLDPLFPLLTGLFGLSSLALSIKSSDKIAKQRFIPLAKLRLSRKETMKGFAAGFFSIPLFSFLPGIGSSHASTFGSELFSQSRKGFLFLTGMTSVSVMALSYITVIAIHKSRSGTALAVDSLLSKPSDFTFTILSAIFLSIIFSASISLFLSRRFCLLMNKIDYRSLSILIFYLLFAINLNFAFLAYSDILISIIHLVILLAATSLGIFCILSGTRRIQLMGALIIPTIIYYLF